MKLFGEYLIEKGIISKADLVKALVIQLQSTPSVAEIVFENNLRNPDEIFNIFQLQFKRKIGFIEAARELGYWSDKIQNEVEKKMGSTRVPLGEILVQTGLSSLDTITHVLDDFLANVSSEKESEETLLENSEQKIIENSPVDASVMNGGNDQCRSYYEYFDLDKFLELTLLFSFRQSGVFSKERLEEIVSALHTLKGSARFAKLSKSEVIINSIENKFQSVIKVGTEKMTPQLIEKIEVFSLKYLDLMWTIREDLQKGLSEDESILSRNLEGIYKQLAG